jgi:integrase
VWTKPAHTTKQKRIHRAPLNKAAIALLEGLPRDGDYVFPGRFEGEPIGDIRGFWNKIRETANLQGLRLHDLRHTYASLLASQGLSLPIIGQLLGHTQAHTTHRYAHLLDEPLKDATNIAGNLIEGARK